MKKFGVLLIAMGFLLGVALVPSSALATQGGSLDGGAFGETAIAVNGPWLIYDEVMGVPGYFSADPWTYTSKLNTILRVTDLYVTGDRYTVFDGATLLFSTPVVKDGGFDANWTDDPNVAWGNPAFSKGSAMLAPGSHSISIRVDHIPAGFSDATVALRVLVPEPASLLLLGSGLIGLAGFGRKKIKKEEEMV